MKFLQVLPLACVLYFASCALCAPNNDDPDSHLAKLDQDGNEEGSGRRSERASECCGGAKEKGNSAEKSGLAKRASLDERHAAVDSGKVLKRHRRSAPSLKTKRCSSFRKAKKAGNAAQLQEPLEKRESSSAEKFEYKPEAKRESDLPEQTAEEAAMESSAEELENQRDDEAFEDDQEQLVKRDSRSEEMDENAQELEEEDDDVEMRPRPIIQISKRDGDSDGLFYSKQQEQNSAALEGESMQNDPLYSPQNYLFASEGADKSPYSQDDAAGKSKREVNDLKKLPASEVFGARLANFNSEYSRHKRV